MSSKREMFVLVLFFASLLVFSSFASASMFDWFGKITGRVTQNPVNLTITVGNTAPQVILVTSPASVNLNEGPASTPVVINFTVYDKDGGSNINDSSAATILNFTGDPNRQNITCSKVANYGPNSRYANYTCLITLWWFDAAGAWTINASIKDNNGAAATNTTTSITVNALKGFVSSPQALVWNSLSPGDENQTSINDPILMNNTGNQGITSGNVQMNATTLRGETTSSERLYAGNFSVGTTTGGSPPAECGSSIMYSNYTFAPVSSATLPRGNFTVNDGSTGQEQLYVCLKLVGSEISPQTYSTVSEGPWTLKIV